MRGLCLSLACLVLVGFLFTGDSLAAEGKNRFIQLALFDPVQIFPRTDSIKGLRLSIYGGNQNVTGLDIGIVNRTYGTGKGVFGNLLGMVDGDFYGVQVGAANITKGTFHGVQWGAVNSTRSGEGVQLGFVNLATRYQGLQVAIVNITEYMHGLQIGLINVISSKEKTPILPIVNWCF